MSNQNNEYNHEQVLRENTRPSTPKELYNLRLFAFSLSMFFIILITLLIKYIPADRKKNRIINYRMSSVTDNYCSNLDYYKF